LENNNLARTNAYSLMRGPTVAYLRAGGSDKDVFVLNVSGVEANHSEEETGTRKQISFFSRGPMKRRCFLCIML